MAKLNESDLLQTLRDLHADVESLVEYIVLCEQDGGQAYDIAKTRRLLNVAKDVIAKYEGKTTQ